jgi:hypothetical protein
MSVSLRLKTVETAPKPPVVVRYRRPVDRRSKPRHLQDAVANRRDARSSSMQSRGSEAKHRAARSPSGVCRAATSTVWARGSVHLRTSQTQFRPSLCVNTPPSAEATQTKPAMDRVKRPGAGMSQAISASDFGCHASIADRAIVNATRERRAVHLIRAGSSHGQYCKCNRNAVTTDYRRRS